MTPDRRRDALTGAEVVVVAGRQTRPNQPAADGCPFCVGGLEAPEPYDVRAFPNRWPPLADGCAEVLLYSPDHEASLGSMPVDAVERLVALWVERTAAIGARDDVAYVLVFENRGAAVGATIPHPHGQLFAFDAVPPAALVELDGDGCALCAPPPDDLVVTTSGTWSAFVPEAATWPYELRLVPSAHVGALRPSRDLAALLVDVFARLDRLFDAPMPYMLWWHQRPTDDGDWPAAHVHAHVAPLLRAPDTPRFVAAGELGSGVFFNPVDPAAAADALRRA